MGGDSLPRARLGKVRRKWAKGARPAADSQPQGGGDGTPGYSVDEALGPFPSHVPL